MTGEIILLVYRPEVWRADGDPFSGIEVFGVYETDAEAMLAIDAYRPTNPGWKWHLDSAPSGVSGAIESARRAQQEHDQKHDVQLEVRDQDR